MRAKAGLLLFVMLLTPSACGDDGASGGGGGSSACQSPKVATGESCGSADECCSGFCANARCAAENLDWTKSCAPAPCAGNPEGVWTLVSGCADSALNALDTCLEAGKGAVAAGESLTVTAGGAESTTYGYTVRACGFTSKGGGHTLSSNWDATAETVGGYSYCVAGDTLYLYAGSAGLGPHVTAFVFER